MKFANAEIQFKGSYAWSKAAKKKITALENRYA